MTDRQTESVAEAQNEVTEGMIRLETERDMYKKLYEQLFERLLGGTA